MEMLLQKSRGVEKIINEREFSLRYNLFVCFYKSLNLCEKCHKGQSLGQSFEAILTENTSSKNILQEETLFCKKV